MKAIVSARRALFLALACLVTVGLLQFLSNMSCAQRAFASQGSSKTSAPPFFFFMYSGPEFELSPECYQCWYYQCTTKYFVSRLQSHPWRTHNPELASLFVIPFDLFASFSFQGKFCNGTWHHQRVSRLLDALAASPWFVRRGGWDHYWGAHIYLVGRSTWTGAYDSSLLDPPLVNHPSGILHNVTFGHTNRNRAQFLEYVKHPAPEWDVFPWHWIRFDGPAFRLKHRAVVVPSDSTGWSDDITFNQWKQRRTLFWFRGGHRACAGATQEQRDFLMQHVAPLLSNSSMHALAVEGQRFIDEVTDAKFCFVVRCDSIDTSRFADAIAHNCIPVTLSDGWRLQAAPFFQALNYDKFTMNIPERMLRMDPGGAINAVVSQPESEYRAMFSALQEARRALCWKHPQSVTHEYILREARLRAADMPADLANRIHAVKSTL